MVGTIFPFGSINEKCIRSVAAFNDEFVLSDDCGNVWKISATTYEDLKTRGFPVNDFRRRR